MVCSFSMGGSPPKQNKIITKCPRVGLKFGLGGDLLCNLHYGSNRVRRRRSRGLQWIPEGRQSTDKSGAGFIFLSSLRLAHMGRVPN